MISEKMADAVDYYLDLENKAWGGNDEIAQAVVNAAWHKFDKNDELDERVPYVVELESEHIDTSMYVNGEWVSERDGNKVVRYAHPADLMFKD